VNLYIFIKRLFDILISIIGCVFLIPLTIIIKILYILSGDFGKVIYVQDRIGKNGEIFKFYKYRTMVNDADDILEKLLKENTFISNEYKKNKKIKNDPRITKMGKIIRKFNIDEFPQFINILIGNMSFIGNRPYLPREREDMGNYYYDIIKTKPGITGLWQTSGRNDVSFKRRLKLEKKYSNNCNLWLDIKIFLKTIIVFLKINGK